MIVILSVVGVMLLTCIVFVSIAVGTYNTQAGLKNRYEMKVVDNTSEFDNLWKKLNQVAQIPDKKKDALKEIFNSYASARTSPNQGQMMSWIKEAIPNADMSIYDNLMNIVIASRDSWTMRQKELVSIAEVYNGNLVTFPNNIFLGMFGFKKINPEVITSTKTENVFKSGKDDDTQLFGK